jgi:hypothetical protein
MDKLWEDHITWTRMVIVDFAAGLLDLKTAEARLPRNQADIGNAIKPYYGRAAGNQLTQLLRTHILEAVPVLAAAKAGDKKELAQALNAWYANARQIADFLSNANSRNWPRGMMRSMMRQHLVLTTKEAVRTPERKLARRRRRLRPGPCRDPAYVRDAQHRHHQPVPEPLLTTEAMVPPPTTELRLPRNRPRDRTPV